MLISKWILYFGTEWCIQGKCVCVAITCSRHPITASEALNLQSRTHWLVLCCLLRFGFSKTFTHTTYICMTDSCTGQSGRYGMYHTWYGTYRGTTTINHNISYKYSYIIHQTQTKRTRLKTWNKQTSSDNPTIDTYAYMQTTYDIRQPTKNSGGGGTLKGGRK